MTYNQAIKEIEDYFNLDLTPFNRKRLEGILATVVETEGKEKEYITKNKILKERVYIGHTKSESLSSVDLDEYAEEACSVYKVELDKLFSDDKHGVTVSARIHFCRSIINKFPNYPQRKLAKYLGRNRTMVVHYLYYAKTYCEIPALKEMVYNVQFKPNQLKILRKKKLRKNFA